MARAGGIEKKPGERRKSSARRRPGYARIGALENTPFWNRTASVENGRVARIYDQSVYFEVRYEIPVLPGVNAPVDSGGTGRVNDSRPARINGDEVDGSRGTGVSPTSSIRGCCQRREKAFEEDEAERSD